MGLAVSQVRLLALTSRKADVELQMQVDSKRKTMLTRQSTELSKQYYAKLQNTTIQYSTTSGYNDVTYDYLMASTDSNFFTQVLTGSSQGFDQKTSSSMILTDMYGRVVLSSNVDGGGLMGIYTDVMKSSTAASTVEDKTLSAISSLLYQYSSKSAAANIVNSEFSKLFQETGTTQSGYKMLKYILENGYNDGGSIYCQENTSSAAGGSATSTKTYYTSRNGTEAVTLKNGTFYTRYSYDGTSSPSGYKAQMYFNGDFQTGLTDTYAKEIAHIMQYYGSIFSAAFNNGVSGTFTGKAGSSTDVYKNTANPLYVSASKTETLQAGLKSGLFQLVNVDNAAKGHYSKAQNLDYFITQNLVSERTDESKKEEITAWYNAEKADLADKESYWDSEVTELSTELNSITTEIDSVKSLRDDAISSTFKWGSA